MAQNGLKIEKFRFSVSARNALKWHPNGLKRSQNTFLWPFDPLLAALLPRPQKGPKMAQKGPKMAQNGLQIEKKSIFSFGSKRTKMASKWSKTAPKHISMAFWPPFGRSWPVPPCPRPQKGPKRALLTHLDPFWPYFDLFWPILTYFDPFWPILTKRQGGPAKSGQKGVKRP